MRWLKEGRIRLTDRIVLHEADKKGGSGILREAPDGSEYSMKEYIDLMMQISDNTASDYLVRLVGKEAIYRDVIGPLHLDQTSIDLACEGLLAKCFCHECDHLEGKLFYDNAVRMLSQKEIEEWQNQ